EPQKGHGAWQLASPVREEFPVTAMTVFKGSLYCAAAARDNAPYQVYKADAMGAAPLDFSLVLTGGDLAAAGSLRAVSMAAFGGRLFVGTGAPSGLVRIDADGSWELLVGQPRMTEDGLKRPLSGVSAGLGSAFTVQFRAMASQKGQLYLGTADWSQLLELSSAFADMAQLEFGFDLFR